MPTVRLELCLLEVAINPAARLPCIVLHAHLPFVRHPEQPNTLEEDWLYEAITETYIPLLQLMEGWERDNIPTGSRFR